MRRFAMLSMLLASIVFGGINTAVAQDATPEAMPQAEMMSGADLALPELVMSYDGSAFQVPAEIAAGRYLVTFTNNDAESFMEPGFLLNPGELTLADIQAQMEQLNSEDASPEAFTWLYDKTFAGGVVALPGQTEQVIVDLTPGDWFIVNEDSTELPTPVAEISVTGDMPADLAEPESTATFAAVGTADGYDFVISGQVTTGTQIIKFINKTDQLHFIGTFHMSEAINDAQFMEILMMPEEATPEPSSDLAGVEYLGDGPQSAVISDGQTMWLIWNFTPGYWNATCFMPEERSTDGTPHAFEGMVEPFEVAE